MSIPAMPALTADVRPGWKVTVAGAADQDVRLDRGRFTSDAELVGACVAGEPGAFDVLVERHRRNVYHLCYRFVGTHEDASDLSQEVFLRVHRGLHRFKGNAALSTCVVPYWRQRLSESSHGEASGHRTDQARTACRPDKHESSRSRGAQRAGSQGQGGHCAATEKAAGDAHPARLSRVVTPGDLRYLGEFRRAVKANLFHALGNLKKLLASEQP